VATEEGRIFSPTSASSRECDVIFRMVAENPTWGAPRIHGELLMLGFAVSERTISRWMKRVREHRFHGGSANRSTKLIQDP